MKKIIISSVCTLSLALNTTSIMSMNYYPLESCIIKSPLNVLRNIPEEHDCRTPLQKLKDLPEEQLTDKEKITTITSPFEITDLFQNNKKRLPYWGLKKKNRKNKPNNHNKRNKSCKKIRYIKVVQKPQQ